MTSVSEAMYKAVGMNTENWFYWFICIITFDIFFRALQSRFMTIFVLQLYIK